jgi:Na+/H+-dicarboxylate symporters
MLLKLLKQLPVQLVLSISLALFLGHNLDLQFVSAAYTVSSCFIEILLFFLPLIVFNFILRALVNIKQGSLKLVLLLFAGVTISNCMALVTAYLFGSLTLPFFGVEHSPDFASKFSSSVDVLYRFNFPQWISTEKAMAVGIVSGIALSFLSENSKIKRIARDSSEWLSDKIGLFLGRIFIPLLPIYVFGFCIKLSYDDALVNLFQQYGRIFLLSMVLVVGYIFTLYFIASKSNLSLTLKNLKTMMPAGLTGFSTMSSAATMPVTLECTEATTQDKNFTNLVIPSTANIHMLGDDLTIVMTAMTLLSVFGMPWPDLATLVPFVLAFSMAKLSCVGIPGASVLVILPVLQGYLGFTPEMISILTTIYVLQDPFGTAANVMGNGAFALITQRLFRSPQNNPTVSEATAGQ